MDDARSRDRDRRRGVRDALRPREGRARSRSPATPTPSARWSRSGRSATPRRSCSTTTTTCSSSAFTPTGRFRRRSSRPRWRAPPYVSVVDRAAAFGSFGPLGADVRSLDLPHAKSVTNVICGVGGTEVTPDTLRWALEQTRAQQADAAPGLRPGGGLSVAAWLDEIVTRGAAPPSRPQRLRRLRPRDQHPSRARRARRGRARSKTVLVIPASCWTIIAGIWPVNAFDVAVHLTPFASAAAEASAIKAALRLRGPATRTSSSGAATARRATSASPGVSAAAERNEDILYVLNDNEAYMNTGVQKSGATPEGAWTTTTPAARPEAGPEEGHRPDHGRARDPVRRDARARARCRCCKDFRAKVTRAAELRGLPVPARPRRLPARLAVPDGPVDRDRAARRRVAVLPALRVRPRRVADHVPAEAPGAGRRVPGDAGPLRPPLAGADRDDPGARGRALGALAELAPQS